MTTFWETLVMVNTLIAILFVDRDCAHREHLRASTYAHHVIFEDLYTALLPLTDAFIETYQGMYGILADIPLLDSDTSSFVEQLKNNVAWIEDNRNELDGKKPRALQSILDEICCLYYRTLYKLENLS